jgi:hypothetical protein
MPVQAPAAVLMVRPANFGFNTATAPSNAFQQRSDAPVEQVHAQALAEFDAMLQQLRSEHIEVHVVSDTPHPITPDAIFPNNWVSFHPDGRVILYPMMAPNRRWERRPDILEQLRAHFQIVAVDDLSEAESRGKFLEGTGSLVFDYVNHRVYALRSPRTHEDLVHLVAAKLHMAPVIFDAWDERGQPIYHTNVLMCVGTCFAVICLDAIPGDRDQETLLSAFADTGHKVIAISFRQMAAFAGNMMEVVNARGEHLVLLSRTAYEALVPGQRQALQTFARLVPISIPTIEQIGGGSVRCMVAGIFLPTL